MTDAERRYRDANRERVRFSERRAHARERGATLEPFTLDQWLAVVAFYRDLCAFCGRRQQTDMTHLIRLSQGGPHAIWNVVPSCGECNDSKRGTVRVPHPFMKEITDARSIQT